MTAQDRVLIFIPAYNCAEQIPRVIAQLDAPWIRQVTARAIVVDNCSSDSTFAVASAEAAKRPDGFVKVFRNTENYGLGGSHKIAFNYARANGYDWVLVLHGDDQGSISDFRSVLETEDLSALDAVLGSRFMRDSKAPGYSRFRIFGNHVFNAIYSAALGRRVRDLGSGLNLLRVQALPKELELAPDDLTFNCVLLCSLALRRTRMTFHPITWREDDQVSNVKLFRQSLRTLGIAVRAFFGRSAFLSTDQRPVARSYPAWGQ